jgi:exodeoxyribonuclease VII small subunit
MTEKKTPTFEEKLNRLNEVVLKVETGSLPIEETMKLYEEGRGLIKDLQKTLEEAEKKIGTFKKAEGEPKK